MADFFTLGTEARYIAADTDNIKKVWNNGASNVGRNSTSAVVVTDNALTTGQSYTASAGFWYVSAASSKIMVEPVGTPGVSSDITVQDDVTVGDTLTVTGVTTLTGGVGATTTKARALDIATVDVDTSATLSALGTDSAAADNKTVYLCSLFVPANCTVTGIATLNGTNITTDKIVNYLFNATGTKVGQTAAAGTAPTPADVFQEIDLTAPVAITGPAVYFVGRQHNGTTIGKQTIPADKGVQPLSGSVAGDTFGTTATVVPPTAYAADKGPLAYLY